jgi:hypothetical protein
VAPLPTTSDQSDAAARCVRPPITHAVETRPGGVDDEHRNASGAASRHRSRGATARMTAGSRRRDRH